MARAVTRGRIVIRSGNGMGMIEGDLPQEVTLVRIRNQTVESQGKPELTRAIHRVKEILRDGQRVRSHHRGAKPESVVGEVQPGLSLASALVEPPRVVHGAKRDLRVMSND